MAQHSITQVDSSRAQTRRIWGWMAFDWAAQPYSTLLLTFVFGPYFASILVGDFTASGMGDEEAKAQAQAVWSLALTVAGLVVAASAPVLGSLADVTQSRIKWIWGFSVLYVTGSAALWWTYPDASNYQVMICMFIIGFIGMEFATIFTNALLPSLGDYRQVGKLSGSGFALGYLGGLLSLTVMMLFFAENESGVTFLGISPLLGLDAEMREGTRFVGPFTALWYMVAMIPFFLWVKEPALPSVSDTGSALVKALRHLWRTVASLRQRVSLSAYLGSSLLYRDALNGIYAFGGVYATLVLDWSIIQAGIFGIVAGFSACVFSWTGGFADRRFGPKPVIWVCICVLIPICGVIVNMSRESFFGFPIAPGSSFPDTVFYFCGICIGGAGGALQASSRSLMVRYTQPDSPSEAFGLYALSGRITAFLAPALIGAVTLYTGSTRLGIGLPLIALFLAGMVLLWFVDPEGDVER